MNLKVKAIEPQSPQADITPIPLSKLKAWDGNPRKNQNGIEELEASIMAHGLLQALIARPEKDGSFTVVAGGRRLRALQNLVEKEKLQGDPDIECHIVKPDADALEIALAENTIRAAMHPADQFEAFHNLAKSGTPAADIGARFGVSENTVLRYLRLATLSPKIIEAWREDKITMEKAQAYAATDDHEKQEEIFEESKRFQWRYEDADDIRQALTEEKVTAADPRVKFIGLEAYRAAGGKEARDLFTENDKGIFILDVDLLDSLAGQKIEEEKQKLLDEGWAWVHYTSHSIWRYANDQKLERGECKKEPLSTEVQEKIAMLEGLAQSIEDKVEQEDRDLTDEEENQLDEIEDQTFNLRIRREIWSDKRKADGGVIITLDRDGRLEIERGYFSPKTAKSSKPTTKKKAAGKVEEALKKDGDKMPAAKNLEEAVVLTQALVKDLTGYKTASLAAATLEKPDIALAAAVHVIAGRILYDGYSGMDTCLNIQVGHGILSLEKKTFAGSRGWDEFNQVLAEWKEKAPDKKSEFWSWCLEQDRETLVSLLAIGIAGTIEAVADTGKARPDNMLAEAIGIDLADWFTPTADNYFSQINKLGGLVAIKEATGKAITPAQEKMKKDALAEEAERQVAGTRWIPSMLRLKHTEETKQPQKSKGKTKPKKTAKKKTAA